MLSALARWTTARPRLVVALTLAAVMGLVVVGGGVGDRLRSGGMTDPASQGATAARVLDARFPASRPNLTLLVRSTRSVDDRAIVAEADRLIERLTRESGVVGVTSYWQTRAPTLRAADGRSALILARIEGDETDADRVYERIAPAFRGRAGDLDVRLGGAVAQRHEAQATVRSDLRRAELIALPITLAILVVVFGSAVAALLPLLVGIIAIVGTNAVLKAVTGVTDVSIFAQNLTTALGLGLAVDYALLVVRRFREELAAGHGRWDVPAVIGASHTCMPPAGKS